MANLSEYASSTTWSLFDLDEEDLPPRGTYPATIIDIRDKFGAERKKFQSEEMERVNLTQFLFGFRDAAGEPHRITSKVMRISPNPKSALHAFLTAILGEAPKMNWDYVSLKGRTVLITVGHTPKRMNPAESFATITSVSPMPDYPASAAPATGQVQPPPAPRSAPVPAPVEDEGPLPF